MVLMRDVHRSWVYSAVAQIAFEQDLESLTVRQIAARAGLNRRRFYELFESREDCLDRAFEQSIGIAAEGVLAAYRTEGAWVDRIRAALHALLTFLDSEPELARLSVLQAVAATPLNHRRRSEVLDKLATAIDEGRREAPMGTNPPPLTAESVVGGTLAALQSRLLPREPERLGALLGPLMSVIVLPYLGQAAARDELTRATPRKRATQTTVGGPDGRSRSLDARLTNRAVDHRVRGPATPALGEAANG